MDMDRSTVSVGGQRRGINGYGEKYNFLKKENVRKASRSKCPKKEADRIPWMGLSAYGEERTQKQEEAGRTGLYDCVNVRGFQIHSPRGFRRGGHVPSDKAQTPEPAEPGSLPWTHRIPRIVCLLFS